MRKTLTDSRTVTIGAVPRSDGRAGPFLVGGCQLPAMTRGILEWVGLVATLALAVPIAFMGADFLLAGKPLGWAFLLVAAAAVAVEEYAVRPTNLPGSVAGKLAGTAAKEPEDD